VNAAGRLLLLAAGFLLAACGGGLSDGDRTACDLGHATQTALDRATRVEGSESLREENAETGRRAWDAARGAAALSDDDRLSSSAAYWGDYSSPLIERDVGELLEWCRTHGWEPPTSESNGERL
jgi:hypothetical protein